jgi:hypothetical protein
VLLLILLLPAAPRARQAQTAEGVKSDEVSTPSSPVALPPEKKNPVRVPRFERAPAIDGKLDEEAWAGAAVLKDFYQVNPGDNARPTYPTRVLLGYDARNLYVAFDAKDDPSKVQATLAKRDAVLGTDDSVRILLDTFDDKRRAYVLVFNPLGIQQDGVRTEGVGVDFSVDIVMESKGRVTEDGFVVEVAVPFKSLRYTAGPGRRWGVQVFRRTEHRNREEDSWMPLSRNDVSIMGQAGHLTGLEDLSTERALELIPSLTLSETGKRVRSVPPSLLRRTPGLTDSGRFVNEPLKLDPGLTAKFGLTPTVTLDVALNPDFAQVEADQLVVTTNQRFPIFFAEKRPFFLEGIEIFNTPLDVVHTRAVVDPDAAVKLTGKRGRNSFGLLLASDNGPGDFVGDERLSPSNQHFLDRNATVGVVRLKRDVGNDSSLGLIATSYDFKADDRPLTSFDLATNDPCAAEKSLERTNRLGGFDGHFRLDKISVFDFQIVGSNSRRCFTDPVRGGDFFRTGNGLGYSAVYDVTGRNVGWTLGAEGQTRDYSSDAGFTQRNDYNTDYFAFRYSTDPKPKARLTQWEVSSLSHLQYDFRGRLLLWDADVTAFWYFPRNTEFWVAYRRGHERLYEEEFGPVRTPTRAGTFFGRDVRGAHKNHYIASFSSQPGKTFGGTVKLAYRDGTFDLDLGGGPRFQRVSPAALADPDAPQDPGPGRLLDLSGNLYYQPTDAARFTLNYLRNRLRRDDTGLVAFDDRIYSLRGTYQFTRFVAARARLDYTTLQSRARAQFLFAWTPNPGTALYAGYNDDVNRDGFNPFSRLRETGLRRNGRTFFVKMSYLFRRSL